LRCYPGHLWKDLSDENRRRRVDLQSNDSRKKGDVARVAGRVAPTLSLQKTC
jgi:hypothetical protein